MRRYDIDHLRVIVFALLILYHTGMFFVPWQYHLKNPVTYNSLIYPMLFLNQWRLPLLFIISGMGAYFALSKRSSGRFAVERARRLLVPLAVGIAFVVPPQLYFERLDQGAFTGGFFEFWPAQIFTKPYPEGNSSWHHLWFLPYLFLYSMAFLPAFLYLRKHYDGWFMRFAGKMAGRTFGIYVFTVPLVAWELLLAPYFPSTHALLGDWYDLLRYATLFFNGFLLVGLKDVFWNTALINRRAYLITGLGAFALLAVLRTGAGAFPDKDVILALARVFNLWSWCMAAIGYAAAYLNRETKTLKYAGEAVYPFYILHQTVTIILCYYLKDWNCGFLPKFAAIAIGTFGVTWLLYEYGVRRYSLVRPLFGLKKSAVNNYSKINSNI
ncbi:MAG: acyltransferase family protein [Tannerellaceae bacterium]|jgi:hypothetical protein|nr:acyltransferase family protein [Tannerellaceae bacterium]